MADQTVSATVVSNLMIDWHWLRQKQACYEDADLQLLFPRPRTLEEVLTLREGLWEAVPGYHRLWVASRDGVLSEQARQEWQQRSVYRALLRVPFPTRQFLQQVEELRAGDFWPRIRELQVWLQAQASEATKAPKAYAVGRLLSDFVCEIVELSQEKGLLGESETLCQSSREAAHFAARAASYAPDGQSWSYEKYKQQLTAEYESQILDVLELHVKERSE